jgi:hypothetical protein
MSNLPTLLSPNAITFLQQQEAFARFRRALRKQDQQVLDDLFDAASQHAAAAALADRTHPVENMLLCMLLEQRKEINHLRDILERSILETVEPVQESQ